MKYQDKMYTLTLLPQLLSPAIKQIDLTRDGLPNQLISHSRDNLNLRTIVGKLTQTILRSASKSHTRSKTQKEVLPRPTSTTLVTLLSPRNLLKKTLKMESRKVAVERSQEWSTYHSDNCFYVKS